MITVTFPRGIALLVGLAALVLASPLEGNARDLVLPDFGARSSSTRPSPSVARELDQLRREGAVDPLTRRRLGDQLRQSPPGAGQRQGERTLEQLPTVPGPGQGGDVELERRSLPPAELPSSLPPGFGESE